eukprot:scaffold1004_cov269-Pinguiococcus_pyrenoidosus.AAC.7
MDEHSLQRSLPRPDALTFGDIALSHRHRVQQSVALCQEGADRSTQRTPGAVCVLGVDSRREEPESLDLAGSICVVRRCPVEICAVAGATVEVTAFDQDCLGSHRQQSISSFLDVLRSLQWAVQKRLGFLAVGGKQVHLGEDLAHHGIDGVLFQQLGAAGGDHDGIADNFSFVSLEKALHDLHDTLLPEHAYQW